VENCEVLHGELQTQRDLAREFERQVQAEVQRCQGEQERCKERDSQIAVLKEQLATKEAECQRFRKDTERQNKVVKELTEGLASANAANERCREQLQVYEAADRRAYSYAPRSPKTLDDNASGKDAVSSPLPSSREMPGSAPTSARARPKPNVSKQMDDNERDAFLSHFPMASRTERLLRNRIEQEKRNKPAQR